MAADIPHTAISGNRNFLFKFQEQSLSARAGDLPIPGPALSAVDSNWLVLMWSLDTGRGKRRSDLKVEVLIPERGVDPTDNHGYAL